MSRSSDTRQRTREAAAQLVASGHRAHAITVDLIYAAIRQGSRTTINDELKLWKDDKAQADALGAELPPVVAERMRSLWVLAAEHGERLFEQRRGELESALATVREQLTTRESELDQLRDGHERLNQQLTTVASQLAEVRQQLASESAAKNSAVSAAHALQQELTALRVQAAQQLEAIRQEQEGQAREFRQAIAARDATFRMELDTATQRLEAAQAHMLQQIDEARQGQRRAQSQVATTQQQRDQLQNDVTELRMQLSIRSQQLKERDAAVAAATQEATSQAAERQRLMSELAGAHGRLEGAQSTVQALQARAVAAEARLSELTPPRKRSPRAARAEQG